MPLPIAFGLAVETVFSAVDSTGFSFLGYKVFSFFSATFGKSFLIAAGFSRIFFVSETLGFSIEIF